VPTAEIVLKGVWGKRTPVQSAVLVIGRGNGWLERVCEEVEIELRYSERGRHRVIRTAILERKWKRGWLKRGR